MATVQPNNNSNNNNNNNNNNRSGKSNRRGGKGNNNNKKNYNKNNNSFNNRKGNNQGKGNNNYNNNNDNNKTNKSNNHGRTNNREPFPPHWSLEDCLTKYNAKDVNFVRGTLRAMPGNDSMAFCTCDRGIQAKDVVIQTSLDRNRAMDRDVVFVEILGEIENDINNDINSNDNNSNNNNISNISNNQQGAHLNFDEEAGDAIPERFWQDDPMQMRLWNPIVPIRRVRSTGQRNRHDQQQPIKQCYGRVVHIVPPKSIASEITPTRASMPFRTIVGTLRELESGTLLLTPNNKSLPQFKCVGSVSSEDRKSDSMFQARYIYGTWEETHKWPPCCKINRLQKVSRVEEETQAILIETNLDHGEFTKEVLEESGKVVASGEYLDGTEMGWKPTPEMLKGRKDLRHKRVFTIDPTTARDLDDALHIDELPNGQVEIGVHIADVSYFVQPETAIDTEAKHRTTTVYMVDRVNPMLPRPLCEIACSLNENVERLAFSCIWRMNKDGTVASLKDSVWYGRTVIKSCARLDYKTAQNIIDRKVAIGENEMNEEMWPTSRRPTGGHTIAAVASDVRLMNVVAKARRQLRFANGAIALNAVKLTFRLDGDGVTPLDYQPYEIRDSNRLIEEYMLLANFLVAQRLITHAEEMALLRRHEPPLEDGLGKVADTAKVSLGFHINIENSKLLQRSLNRLARECNDELAMQCITEILKTPLRPAEYIVAGTTNREEWSHFALCIPYYTHFTSPIRRYADVLVHRLLQATIDGEAALENFHLTSQEMFDICENCNQKKQDSRVAQERSDKIFLALYLRRKPLISRLGVVLSVGVKAFEVFCPDIGFSTKLYLDEHCDLLEFEPFETSLGEKRIKLIPKDKARQQGWTDEFVIKFFTKVRISCHCKDGPPLDIKLMLQGPWTEN